MTNWQLTAAVRGFRPIASLPDGLICHRRGGLYKMSFDLEQPRLICQLPSAGFIGAIATRSRTLDRIFRVSPTHGVVVGDTLLIARRSEIWRCSLTSGKLELEFVIPDGRRALSFGLIASQDGHQEVVFGEYFENFTKEPVRIWGRNDGSAAWAVRATFQTGEIEHIHAVSMVQDRVLILTGDFGQAAGIWMTDPLFSSLVPLLRGQQAFRSAWVRELAGRVYFATDTQLDPNHIYELSIGDTSPQVRQIAAIGGSSIYASQGRSDIFFSTTIECGAPSGKFFKDLLETKPGTGITSSTASVMCIDSNGAISEIFSAEKDFWPFRLAQFGTFTFPAGLLPADTVVAYGIALKGADDTCFVFKKS